jgi:hypothetical protein
MMEAAFMDTHLFIAVIPAKAGIQDKRCAVSLGPCFRGDDDLVGFQAIGIGIDDGRR